MLFGLSNAPSTFTRFMNQVFQAFSWRFRIVYFSKILIFSESKEEYIFHWQQVIWVLRQEKLYINIKKNAFMINNVVFFEFVVSSKGVKIDLQKVKVIQELPTSKTLHEI